MFPPPATPTDLPWVSGAVEVAPNLRRVFPLRPTHQRSLTAGHVEEQRTNPYLSHPRSATEQSQPWPLLLSTYERMREAQCASLCMFVLALCLCQAGCRSCRTSVHSTQGKTLRADTEDELLKSG